MEFSRGGADPFHKNEKIKISPFHKSDQKCLIHPENKYYENNIYQSYPPVLGH